MRREKDALRSLRRFVGEVFGEPWDVRLTAEGGARLERPFAIVEQVGASQETGRRDVQEVTIPFTINLYLKAAGHRSRAAAADAALDVREQLRAAVKWGPDLRRPTPDMIPLWSYEPRCAWQRVRVGRRATGSLRLRLGSGAWTAAVAATATPEQIRSALGAVLDTTAAPPRRRAARNVQVVRRGAGVFDVVFVGDLAGLPQPLLEVDASGLSMSSVSVRHMLHGAPAPWRSQHDFMRVLSFGQTTVHDPDEPHLVQVAADLRCTFARTLPLPFDLTLIERISATGGNGS